MERAMNESRTMWKKGQQALLHAADVSQPIHVIIHHELDERGFVCVKNVQNGMLRNVYPEMLKEVVWS